MRPILAAALLCASISVHSASLIAKQGSDWVRIYDQPCADKNVLPRLPEAVRGEYQKAEAFFGGKTFSACWVANGGGVHLIYEDGDQGIVPFRDLKEDAGV
jgi:hypothetical protein